MKFTDGYCWQIKYPYEPEYSAEVFDYTEEDTHADTASGNTASGLTGRDAKSAVC